MTLAHGCTKLASIFSAMGRNLVISPATFVLPHPTATLGRSGEIRTSGHSTSVAAVTLPAISASFLS